MESKILGKTVDGKDINLLTIRNGEFKVSILTFGATLYYYGTDDLNIVLNHERLEDYFDDPSYMGEVVGPVANRIAKGRFSLDGVDYRLDINNGPNNLHSGSACFGQKLWSVIGVGDSSVTLSLHTEDGLGGFPGSHDVRVTYSLDEDGSLTLYYQVSSDKKCPVAITNHAYFNLDGGGDIRSTSLLIESDMYVAVDESLIPVSINKVLDSDFDFTASREIGLYRDGKYDNTFILRKNGQIKAVGEKAWLLCKTSEPGVQLYTGEYLEGDHETFSGFCLETGRYPDTPNQESFPKAYTSSTEEYVSITTYKMGVR